MKKSVATYIIGLIVGSVVGFGSLASASVSMSITQGPCVTDRTAYWTGTTVRNPWGSDVWVKCWVPSSITQVTRLDVKVYDRGSASRVKARAEWGTTGYVSWKYASNTTTSLQVISFQNPWPASAPSPAVKVLLPANTTQNSSGNELYRLVFATLTSP